MHTHRFDDWIFNCDGDPIPGPVHIRKFVNPFRPDTPVFCTTAEEIVCFVISRRLNGSGIAIGFKTTWFELKPDGMIRLTANPAEEGFVDHLDVPYEALCRFVDAAVRSRFQSFIEQHQDSTALMAGIGMFMFMTAKHS